MSFPGNWFELIMSPSILPIIVPGMLHHLRNRKKIGFDYIIKLLSMNTIFYSLFETQFSQASQHTNYFVTASVTKIRFYIMNNF